MERWREEEDGIAGGPRLQFWQGLVNLLTRNANDPKRLAYLCLPIKYLHETILEEDRAKKWSLLDCRCDIEVKTLEIIEISCSSPPLWRLLILKVSFIPVEGNEGQPTLTKDKDSNNWISAWFSRQSDSGQRIQYFGVYTVWVSHWSCQRCSADGG